MSRRNPTLSEFKCKAKHRYASHRIAAIRAGQLGPERGLQLNTYRCPHCKGWHLTRQTKQGARKQSLVLARA